MKLTASFVLLAVSTGLAAATALGSQAVLSQSDDLAHAEAPLSDGQLLERIEQFSGLTSDPVELYKLVDPAGASDLDEPRLLYVWELHKSEDEAEWATEGDKLRLHQQGLKFTDITETRDLGKKNAVRVKEAAEYPPISYQSQVRDVISNLTTQNMYDNLEKFTSFFNRFYRSENGAASSHWLYLQVLDIIAKAPASTPLSIRKFTNPFPQSSVIARFEPKYPSPNKTAAVIIGAHQDSANYRFPLLPAPGADDDGSGTVTILEAFRALVEKGFTPEYPVEFHWYAAEEGGLLGSRQVAAEYERLGRDVRAMIQFDMTAYTKQNHTATVALITNDVDIPLTEYVISLAEEYADYPVQRAKLVPGAGSDHMSWHKAGYAGAFATEGDPFTEFDPYIHGANDTMHLPNGEFSFEHALEFSKVAVAFAVELGGWV
ncbi:Zn-dependent exopeptidase [Gloeophyllum trabeum ATCC 11539]|uniref:Peptide hydrolase n=1 Tax=Gloeophyllum trabeum (strain ATCC 11539 / FP-39264 / Madison 617) TaxID=670483 RepID=S7QGV4_GLOTA|nr:Zn-dependent exopeptidase [Gloeophyllum trabeum ATCC 11539]EPQ58473.1 Zn-dependent exopeptidase [Gloeophyllum trabeum ATCC 11539]